MALYTYYPGCSRAAKVTSAQAKSSKFKNKSVNMKITTSPVLVRFFNAFKIVCKQFPVFKLKSYTFNVRAQKMQPVLNINTYIFFMSEQKKMQALSYYIIMPSHFKV